MVDNEVREYVQSLAINEPGWGAPAITSKAEERFGQGCVSQRMAGNYIREARGMPPEKQRELLHVHWPESFERGELPWEAAPDVAELIRRRLGEGGERPSHGIAEIFWRTSQIMAGR